MGTHHVTCDLSWKSSSIKLSIDIKDRDPSWPFNPCLQNNQQQENNNVAFEILTSATCISCVYDDEEWIYHIWTLFTFSCSVDGRTSSKVLPESWMAYPASFGVSIFTFSSLTYNKHVEKWNKLFELKLMED